MSVRGRVCRSSINVSDCTLAHGTKCDFTSQRSAPKHAQLLRSYSSSRYVLAIFFTSFFSARYLPIGNYFAPFYPPSADLLLTVFLRFLCFSTSIVRFREDL